MLVDHRRTSRTIAAIVAKIADDQRSASAFAWPTVGRIEPAQALIAACSKTTGTSEPPARLYSQLVHDRGRRHEDEIRRDRKLRLLRVRRREERYMPASPDDTPGHARDSCGHVSLQRPLQVRSPPKLLEDDEGQRHREQRRNTQPESRVDRADKAGPR